MEEREKYCRSLHAHISLGTTSDDRFMPKDYVKAFASLPELILTEKLDGQNNCFKTEGVFARSHAAPPFNNNVDVEHIQKMYSLLAKDAIIVTLTTPYWMTNNEPHQVQFREWLKDKDHKFEMLPDMTFVEKCKTVPTGILILKK